MVADSTTGLLERSEQIRMAHRRSRKNLGDSRAKESQSALIEAYALYFKSGAYERRYPGPNPATLALLLDTVDRHGMRILDFGCGSGRYAIPVARSRPVQVIAYDPCKVALALLRQRAKAAGVADRILPVGGSLASLSASVSHAGPLDLAMLLFGVLGHIRHRSERIRHLREVHRLLRPGGRLVVGVPNGRRRFRQEQKAPWTTPGAREPGDVIYKRKMDGRPVELFYHVYKPGEVEGELEEGGFEPVSVRGESIFPERLVSHTSAAAAFDGALLRVLPARLAYGFLVVAAKTSAAP
jgi:tRNA (uracil-5-)-methyltransferase TRM9